MSKIYDVIIIGGGAAGCFVAANLNIKTKNSVLLLEKSNKLLQKVKVSGGGRCNVTHFESSVSEMSKNYPRGQKLLKKTLHHFNSLDTMGWFEQRGVALKVEEDNRVFPMSDDSQTIIDCLLSEMRKNNVHIILHANTQEIAFSDNLFYIKVNHNQTYVSKRVVIATGGHHKVDSYVWLKQLGIEIINPLPSLFTFNLEKSELIPLPGLSVPNAIVKVVGSKLKSEGPVLITHWGFSGPGILKLSAIGAIHFAEKNYLCEFAINWVGQENDEIVREELANIRDSIGSKSVSQHIIGQIPKRLWLYFLDKAQIAHDTNYRDLSKKEMNRLIQILTYDVYTMKGKTTFKEEFVTCGGIDTQQIDIATFSIKNIPNLYVAGEVINVDGITGGFNFQNAWHSAYIVAGDINKSLLG